MVDVPNNLGNIARCQCPACPVQVGSACINAKRPHWDEMQSQAQMESDSYDGEAEPNMLLGEMMGVYCAIGKSNCSDLDPNQNCLCPACPVWHDYGLSNKKYCLKGSAEAIGD